MKILSIDVGIKNLAFCLFEKPKDSLYFRITKWDVANICQQEVYHCCSQDKTGNCKKPAKFKKNNNYYCLKHAKKQEYQFPTSECKPAFIAKQKIQDLHNIAEKYSISYEKPIKKNDLIILINEYISNHFFQPVETKNASKVDLIDIGFNLKYKFNELFSKEEVIDYVIIENQISPIANRMKTIQGMIVQYFIMSDVLVKNVEFISAINKLKDFNKEKEDKSENKNIAKDTKVKTKYSERKKMGITKCLEIVTNDHRFHEHLKHFQEHKKKDDLADSFLQGLWFIQDRCL
jgi:hypothetical protein